MSHKTTKYIYAYTLITYKTVNMQTRWYILQALPYILCVFTISLCLFIPFNCNVTVNATKEIILYKKANQRFIN